jgi:hypothetical protein
MQALAKRVGNRGDKLDAPTAVSNQVGRGPRNQPKRNRRR